MHLRITEIRCLLIACFTWRTLKSPTLSQKIAELKGVSEFMCMNPFMGKMITNAKEGLADLQAPCFGLFYFKKKGFTFLKKVNSQCTRLFCLFFLPPLPFFFTSSFWSLADHYIQSKYQC